MSQPALSAHPLLRVSKLLSPRVGLMILLACTLALGGVLAPDVLLQIALFAASGGLLGMAALARLVGAMAERSRKARLKVLSQFIENDASPSFTTDADGLVSDQNEAAREKFGDKSGVQLIAVLGGLFASPSAVIFRL